MPKRSLLTRHCQIILGLTIVASAYGLYRMSQYSSFARQIDQPAKGWTIERSLHEEFQETIRQFRLGSSCSDISINHAFHALRCHPKGVRWKRRPGGECWSLGRGDSADPLALDVLLNTDLCREVGCRTSPVLKRSGEPAFAYGHSADGTVMATGQAHPNQFLMFLAEMNVPLETRVSASPQDRWTVLALVNAAKRSITPEGGQLAWTVPALAHYVGFRETWNNKFNRIVSVEKLVDALIEHPERDADCGGTHYAYAIAFTIREARIQGFKVPPKWHLELRRLVQLAISSQRDDGSWPDDWLQGSKTSRAVRDANGFEPLRVSGHMLEWLALCRDVDALDDTVIVRAAIWVSDNARRTMMVDHDFLTDEALAHAVHSLTLVLGERSSSLNKENEPGSESVAAVRLEGLGETSRLR